VPSSRQTYDVLDQAARNFKLQVSNVQRSMFSVQRSAFNIQHSTFEL